MLIKEVQLCDDTFQCNRKHLARSCNLGSSYLENYLNWTKWEMKNKFLYTFIVLWGKKWDTMVNRKFKKHREIKVEIINLKTEYPNRETDDTEIGGVVYTTLCKTVVHGEPWITEVHWNAKVLDARSHNWALTPLIFTMNRCLGKRGRRNGVYSQQRTICHHYVTNV